MGQHPEAALPLPRLVGPPAERTAEPALVPAEGRFGLPPLAEHPPVPRPLRPGREAPDHLGAVPLRRLPVVPARVDRDHRRADAQVLPGEPVVALGVEGGVGQHPVPTDGEGRLGQDGAELRGVVGRAGGGGRPGEEVALSVDGGGQLGPGGALGPGPAGEVPGGVPALQAGGINRRRGPLADQAAVGSGRGGAEEEDDEPPFSRSRRWA